MDAGLPILVFASVPGPGSGSAQPAGGQPLRVVPDRPVLLALDLVPVPGAWAGYTVVPLRFVSLGAAHLAMLAPAVVAMPLWARGADAVQMLQRLAELGYSGPVEVHGPRLPDQRMVMAELTQVAEGLQVRLVERPEPA